MMAVPCEARRYPFLCEFQNGKYLGITKDSISGPENTPI